MTLKDYWIGIPVRLHSSFTAKEFSQAVNGATLSSFAPISAGIIGWARLGHLRLQRRGAFFQNGFRGTLSGSVEDTMAGCDIDAAFGVAGWIKLWFVLAALILAVTLGLWVQSLLAGGSAMDFDAPDFFFAIVFFFGPILGVLLALRSGQSELDAILAFLAEHASAGEVRCAPKAP